MHTPPRFETQKYEVIKIYEDAELRYYPSVMKIQSKGEFEPLFKFISGANMLEQKIEMTTPVYQYTNKEDPTMDFVLPERFNQLNTPKPISSKVRVFQSKQGYFLAIHFSGYATNRITEQQTNRLKKVVAKYSLQTVGEAQLLVYNSPYRIFNRKNELIIEVELKDETLNK